MIGMESLDELSAWAEELFSPVPSAPVGWTPPSFKALGLPWDMKARGGQITYMNSVKEKHTLYVNWPMPSLQDSYDQHSADYVGNLLGHEGAGSLLSSLKEKRWATSITAGVGSDGYCCNSALFLFDLEITLTQVRKKGS